MKLSAMLVPVLTLTFAAGSLLAAPRVSSSACLSADTQCGGDKSESKKDEKAPKNPSATPQCGGDKSDTTKKDDKKPST